MSYRQVKRTIDVVGAALLLVANLPVMVVVALLILVCDGRPITFVQRRPGLGNIEFPIVKFRTMRAGSGDDAARLTRLGRVLRTLSLDELPQLINVLRGDMSLVGPRPLLSEYLPLYSKRQARRHEVRPGITGLAQVSGRNGLRWEDRLELDVEYVETQSFTNDVRVMLRTLIGLLTRSGVSAPGHETMPRFQGQTIIDLVRQTGETFNTADRRELPVPAGRQVSTSEHVGHRITS